jgi:ACS family hexuronate transporter-like MFS transporter
MAIIEFVARPTNKWTVCVLLFLATTLNYLDRQLVGILAPALQEQFQLDNEALGWLFAAFYWSYTIAQFGVGGLLDRSHLRWAYGLGVLAWSAAAALTALAMGFAGLVACRLLLGLTESLNWPAAMRVVARVFPPSERSLGNGIFTSGTSVGALIAPGLVLTISHWLGWRATFVVVGSFGLLWFVLWLHFTRDPSLLRVWRNPETQASGSAGRAYKGILRSPRFWRVFVVAILVNPCLYFNLNWLPTFFVQQLGLSSASQLGWMLTVICLAPDLGYLFSGASVLLLSKRGWALGTARASVISVATVCLTLSALVPFVRTMDQGLALLIAANFGAGAWVAMYLTMAQEVSDSHVSTAAGLLGGSGSAAGALAMWMVGRVTSTTSSFAAPFVGVAVAAAIALIAGLAAIRHTSTERT